MQFRFPDRIPVEINVLPATWSLHGRAMDELVERFPSLFGDRPRQRYTDTAAQAKYVEGDYVDAWGCVWSNVRTGMASIVTHHPVPTREDVHSLRVPDANEGLPHGFMYLRLCDLRGFEELMLDFAEEPPELQMLIDIVLAYNLRQLKNMKLAQRSSPEIIRFGDDLGMQRSLPISPQKWRKYLKPCFAELYGRCRDAGHWVYMHTDGHVVEIIPDLIECGVKVLNLQVGANGFDSLAETCKGKICVHLDLDRQQFPFFTADDINDHVREAVERLGSPNGGLWLQAEIGPDVPLRNVETLCIALEKYKSYYRH